MVKGTTPTLYFECDLVWDDIKELSLVFEQNGKIILKFSKSDCIYEDGSLVITLTQEQSLTFSEQGNIKMQIKLKLLDGTVLASEIVTSTVGQILDEEII